MKKNKNTLTCKGVRFYSPKDEDAMFEWIKKINCIDNISGAGDELYLHIASDKLNDNELRELIGLFFRYKIDMKQLKQFKTDDNKEWFATEGSYWFKPIFGSDKK